MNNQKGKIDNIFRFQKFPVYKDVRVFRGIIKQLSKDKFPKAEDYCLKSQLWRALDSILLNIAEGSEKYSDIDFSRFLNIALSSLNEVVACLDCALDDGYITQNEYDDAKKNARNIYVQLRVFSSKVRKS